MADEATHPPTISISRTSTESRESRASSTGSRASQKLPKGSPQPKPQPRVNTTGTADSHFARGKHTESWRHRNQSPDIKWHAPWRRGCFPNGRVLLIDYISNDRTTSSSESTKRHLAVAAQEFDSVKGLEGFYSDPKRCDQAALRVIHVQNARWATQFLLKKFNIDYHSELVGMEGFAKWANYERPRQRNGKPFPAGRSWRVQIDPWRNISRTAFGLDYLKVFKNAPPETRHRRTVSSDRPADASMMHLNTYEDSQNAYGCDVSVQRLSVYVQRKFGAPSRVSPDLDVKNPYAKQEANGNIHEKWHQDPIDLESLDNTNTVIIFETSASLLLEDCLIQPRRDFEKRWRRLSFYLRKEEALDDHLLAAQCCNLILTDIFHGLAVVWQDFLSVSSDHVAILEDKIYENPADESRAPELWNNQAAWLKVDKIIWIHQDLVREMQGHLKDFADDDDVHEEWLNGVPAEFDRVGHSIQEDLVQPTTNLNDLLYKSVGIRDSRQSLQLGLSMWRLSWITFIFLPLTFVVSFFGMNVNIMENYPNVGWWFLAAGICLIFVLFLWYFVKHSLQRRRQSAYQRGIYEHLFTDLSDDYPLLWTDHGALDDVQPAGFGNRIKWRLLQRWFAPEKTVDKKLYASLEQEAGLGAWARLKRSLLKRWLRQMAVQRAPNDPLSEAEAASIMSLHNEPGTINELAKLATPVLVADGEPTAVQQISTYGLRPMSLDEQRRNSHRDSRRDSSGGRHSDERPSSRGSSGIMVEERNLSDSESDAGEGASGSQQQHLPEPIR